MSQLFSELQKLLSEEGIPEFISYLPKEKYIQEVNERIIELSDINIAEIAQNNDLMGYLTDFFAVPKEADLEKIEQLLKKYKPVTSEFFKSESKNEKSQNMENGREQFKSAALASTPFENKKAKIDNSGKDGNIDEHLLERISKEILESGLDITWDDIVGLEDVKKAINEIVLWPMMRPDIFKGLRGPPKGLLLFGPPGTGKTMIGKCIASQCKATFFSISASSLTSKWVGEGEKMVRALFYLARKMKPSVIFIDEIDSLLSQRSENENEGSRKMKTEFLVQFDGAAVGEDDRILVIGATNRPQEIDEAARRRLVKRIYVPLPEFQGRRVMAKNLLKNYPNNINETEFDEIATMTEGYSGSDMFNLCREATLEPLREINDINNFKPEDTREININDFKNSLRQIRRSVTKNDLSGYAEWNEMFGSMNCKSENK